jgi:hypothetical protein
MPSTLTHWRIAIEALRCLPNAGQPPSSSNTLRVMRGKPTDPGYGLPILTFLGAIGPDVSYSAGVTTRSTFFPTKSDRATRGKSIWADLLHYNKSGAFLIELLRRGSHAKAAALRQKTLYYALGHATHIAGDTIIHPFTNTFAGAYHHQSNPTAMNGLGIHFYVEFCHDLATDIQYFHAAPQSLAPRPWLRYLQGVQDDLLQEHEGVSLFSLLKETARAVYDLDEVMTNEFGQKFLSGLRGVLTLSRWLSRYPLVNPILKLSPQLSTHFTQQEIPGTGGTAQALTFSQTLDFATRVAGRLCSLVYAYYDDLTASSSGAGESYARLREDLRDWDLDTGYVVNQRSIEDLTENPSPCITLHHSWYHFLPLRGGQ